MRGEYHGADVIGAVYKDPPDATTYINFAIVYLNKYYVAGSRYYTGDACPPQIGGLDRYHVRTIFKHEIGHALGLTHADGGIMGLIEGHCDRRPNVDRGTAAHEQMNRNGLGSCEPLSVDEPANGDPESSRVKFSVTVEPNPFIHSTYVRYVLPRAGDVLVRVFDARGREIDEVMSGWNEPGRHAVRWDGKDQSGRVVAAGIYLVQVVAQGRTMATRVVLLK